MTNSVPRRNRRSIRLQGYDYSRAGAYFVTICAQNRQCLFGDIIDGAMRSTAPCGRLREPITEYGVEAWMV